MSDERIFRSPAQLKTELAQRYEALLRSTGYDALTGLFDREWYGLRSSDGEALADAAGRAREILAALGGPRGVA